MTPEQKDAYRHLVYCAFVEIRSGVWDIRWWNPWDWAYARRTIRANKQLADDFHNLAFFSATDFKGFDEEMFWQRLRKSSEAFYQKYRTIYDAYFNGEYRVG